MSNPFSNLLNQEEKEKLEVIKEALKVQDNFLNDLKASLNNNSQRNLVMIEHNEKINNLVSKIESYNDSGMNIVLGDLKEIQNRINGAVEYLSNELLNQAKSLQRNLNISNNEENNIFFQDKLNGILENKSNIKLLLDHYEKQDKENFNDEDFDILNKISMQNKDYHINDNLLDKLNKNDILISMN